MFGGDCCHNSTIWNDFIFNYVFFGIFSNFNCMLVLQHYNKKPIETFFSFVFFKKNSSPTFQNPLKMNDYRCYIENKLDFHQLIKSIIKTNNKYYYSTCLHRFSVIFVFI